MKKLNLLKAFALASMPMVNTAIGQDEPNPVKYTGSVSAFNLALTVSTSYDATIKKDEAGRPVKPTELAEFTEWTVTTGKEGNKTVTTTTEIVSKILASKYTTKELLLDLVRLGVIPGTPAAPTANDIKGWSIVKVQATVADAEGIAGLNAGPVKFYAVKKDTAAVELRNYIALDLSSRADAANVKVVSKKVGEADAVVTKSYAGAQKQAGAVLLNLGSTEYQMNGVYAGTSKLGATKTKLPAILFGAAKITSLAGTRGDEAVVEGSATFGAGAAAEDIVATYGANVLVEDEDVITPPSEETPPQD